MTNKLSIALILGMLALTSCKKEITTTENANGTLESPETEVVELNSPTSDNLIINSKNIEDVVNEFKIDAYTALDKYGGKKALVSVGIGYGDMMHLRKKLLYKTTSNFHGLPIIKSDLPLRISIDIDDTLDKNLQGYIQLTTGDISPIYGEDQMGQGGKWYIIYDKKKDLILTGSDNPTNLIAGYIRMKGNPNVDPANIDNLYIRLREENSELLDDLKTGNLYYAEFNMDNSGIDISSYLLPCEYIFEGTISKDIDEKTSNYGISKIDLSLVGSKVKDTKWFIDKKQFFNKQIK